MPNEIVVVRFRSLKKGDSLQGLLTLKLPSGLVLYDCTYHQRQNGESWIGLPARQHTKQDGTLSWECVVGFADKATYARSQARAKQAIERYFEQQNAKKESRQRGLHLVDRRTGP